MVNEDTLPTERDATPATHDRVATAVRVSLLLGSGSLLVPIQVLADARSQGTTGAFSPVMLLQAGAGLALLTGGVGLKRRASWGRTVIVAVVWVAITWTVLFGLYFVVTTTFGMPVRGVLAVGALAVLISAFWVLVLRRALRFMRGPELLRYTREG